MKEENSQHSVSVFTRHISRDEQGTYIEVPFAMPEKVEEIRVSYRVESHGAPKAVVDLGVRDFHRVRGWSGGARGEFRLGREKATPGYMAGDLAPEEWAVLHNAYKVPDAGCTVTVTVEFCSLAPRWLKGDLHTHSVHSDGTYTLEQNAAIMEELGCDFIATTDHNAVSQNFAHPANAEVVMIPGMEFTTNFGHSNFLGVADPLDDFRVRAGHMEDVHARIRTARDRGAKIVLNHPFCENTGWLWDFDFDFDWVEVWNGPWTARNINAVNWWQVQLASGRRLTAICGSDLHRPDPYVKHAMPCAWVYAESKTVGGILDGIGRGHVVMTYSPEGPFIELSCGPYMAGDAVPADEPDRQVKFISQDLLAGDIVKFFDGGGLTKELAVDRDGALDLTLDGTGKTFIRAEVHRHFDVTGTHLMAALTNPIYFDN